MTGWRFFAILALISIAAWAVINAYDYVRALQARADKGETLAASVALACALIFALAAVLSFYWTWRIAHS